MRVLVLAMVLLVAARASSTPGDIRGSQAKDGWSAADKILYGDANYIQYRVTQCSQGSVLRCSVKQRNSDCRCIFEHAADSRAERLLSLRQSGRNRQFERHRRGN